MKAKALALFIAWAFCLTVLPTALTAAEVTVEKYSKSGGFKGIGAGETTSVEKISGLKKREVSTTKMTGTLGGFFSKLAGDTSSDTITDIPADIVIRFNHKDKTYTESHITLPKDMKEKAGEGKEEGKEGKQEKANVKVIRSEVSVKETGEKKNIGGFDCARYIVTWLLETENTDTKARSKTTMTMDLWNAPETRETKALKEAEEDFMKAYVKKMGLAVSDDEAQQLGMTAVATLLGGDEKNTQAKMKELREKMAKVKGFSIATAVKWESEGSGGQEAEGQAQEKPPGESGGLDLSKGFGGLLGGLAKKVGGGQKQAGEAPKGSVIFDSYTEIRKLSVGDIPDADFQVPAGYRPAK